jgi:hypothetical protein
MFGGNRRFNCPRNRLNFFPTTIQEDCKEIKERKLPNSKQKKTIQ